MKAKSLIIGNANYSGNELNNPENDATDIDKTLTRLGFETSLILNADSITQDQAITNFATSIDEYDIGLFYFAGHGFQIDNENYLATIDTNFNDEEHAKHTAFPLNILLSYFSKAKNKTSIIILDACRSLINKKTWYRAVESSGLAPIFAPKGTIIAYATSPGEMALDGTGERNGIYTKALLQHIIAENVPIEEMFKRVRNSVFSFSRGRQTSWEHTSLTGTFCFNSGQLTHSSNVEYTSTAIMDSSYGINTLTPIDSIIKDLKSHNWFIQNPAIDKIHQLDPKTENKNKLFLLGRNILQVAVGGSVQAQLLMDNLSENIKYFLFSSKNHVLNGIIFEVFFNSYGSFRQDELKDDYLYEIYNTLENKEYKKSLDFLISILRPHNDVLFYIPSTDNIGISLDVGFVKNGADIRLDSIKFEGDEILIKEDYSEKLGLKEEITYESFEYHYLKKRISSEIKVPEKMIVIIPNIDIMPEQEIMYPNSHKLMK